MPYFTAGADALYFLSDEDVANGGMDMIPRDCTAITDAQAEAIQNPPLTLAQAQVAQLATLTQDCQNAIMAGFTSSALGTAYSYPSALQDQTNQNTVAQSPSGGLLWCETGGTWSMNAHTQAQAQEVVASFANWLNTCQQQRVALAEQVTAITPSTPNAVAAVQAIAWTNPAQS